MSISFKSLLIQVSQKHNDTKIEILEPIINSFVWKFFIANYHATESKNIILKLISKSSKKGYVEIAKLIFEGAAGTDKGKQFGIAVFKAEANMIAYAQSIHSLADIYSQIIYVSLNLDKKLEKPIPQMHRSIIKINKAISNIPEFTKLHSELNCFLTSNQFEYLNAYVNTTKHRSLIPVKYSVFFEKKIEPTHCFEIERFNYNGSTYKSKYSKEFIEADLIFLEEAFSNIQGELCKSVIIS